MGGGVVVDRPPLSRFFMKISKLFHWLYALLMFLPIVNVFAYTLRYGFNYGNEIPSVTENIQRTVDFNQYLLPDEVSVNRYDVSSYYKDYHLSVTGTASSYFSRSTRLVNSNLYTISGHKYFLNFYGVNTYGTDIFVNYNLTSNYYSSAIPFIFTASVDSEYDAFISVNVQENQQVNLVGYFALYDLTQMFGSGNEPSIQEFVNWCPEPYYDYTLSEYVVIPDYSSRCVSDDVTNHFWLPSFGLVGHAINDVISFLLLNVFGLVVSEGIGFIVCGLFTYWTIISLAWLVFDILMYVPLLVHRWLDKASIS